MATHDDDLPAALDPDDPSGAAELIPANLARGGDAAPLVAHLLEQSNREAAANRAQARELVRAIEQLQGSQEYLGTALRSERKRSRWLLALLAVSPVLGALAVWLVWREVEDVRSDFDQRVAELRERQWEGRTEELEAFHSSRAEVLRDDLDRAWAELEKVRGARGAETDEQRAREAALLADVADLQRRNGELEGLRAELRTAREREGAQAARSVSLEQEIRGLERALGSALAVPPLSPSRPIETAGAGPGRVPTPRPVHVERPPPRAEPSAPAAADQGTRGTQATDPGGAGSGARAPAADAAALSAASPPGAVRDAAALAALRSRLNTLLDLSPDTVRYRLDALGGVSGHTLLEVRASGIDQAGQVVRGLEAERVEISVDQSTGTLLLTFHDGALQIGGRRAPFFDGRYGVALACDVERWTQSGLTCVKFQ